MPGDLLRKLMKVFMTVTIVNDQPQSMATPLPDEVRGTKDFAERRATFEELFSRLDQALDQRNGEVISVVLQGIVDVDTVELRGFEPRN